MTGLGYPELAISAILVFALLVLERNYLQTKTFVVLLVISLLNAKNRFDFDTLARADDSQAAFLLIVLGLYVLLVSLVLNLPFMLAYRFAGAFGGKSGQKSETFDSSPQTRPVVPEAVAPDIPPELVGTLAGLWRGKSDPELMAAAQRLADFTEDARQVIRAEVGRRRLLLEGEST